MTNYEQLDWSPITWALLLGGMAMTAVLLFSLAIFLSFRASQATRPAPAAVPAPEVAEPTAPTAPTRTTPRHAAAA